MESTTTKLNHSWLCLYRDSVYKCTSDTFKLNFQKVSTDGWNYVRDACVVNANEALIVYKDRLYTLNLSNGSHKAYAKNNWDNCVGAVAYKGNAVCIGKDWGTGVLQGKHSWKWDQKHNTTWRDAKMMVKIGSKGYALGTNYIYEIDLDTCQYKQLSKENWGNIRCAVTYNGFIYGFFSSGIWKIGTNGRGSVKVSSDDWGQTIWKCAVNFGKHCYLHLANAIWYVDLSDGSYRKINNQKWDGSRALIPLPDNQTGFTKVSLGRGRKHKLVMVGRNRTSENQQKQYAITVGGSLSMKMETTLETDAILTKASLTLGIERQTSKSEQVTDTMTVPPGKAIAVYQEVKEFQVWSGVKENVIGFLGDNCRETTFDQGGIDDEFPDIKYF